MNIDAVMLLPDSNQIEIGREKNLSSDNNIKMTVSFEVQTYYPAFRKDKVKMEGYVNTSGTGMTDMNQYATEGGFSDYFDQSSDFIGGVGGNTGSSRTPYGATGSFSDSSSYPTGSNPEISNDYFIYSPKRTRWFGNILRAREKSSAPINNPNNSNPNKSSDGNVDK